MNRLIIIDASPLAYRSYYASGTKNLKTSKGVLSGTFFGCLRSFVSLKARFPKSHFIFCFDSGDSWRNQIYKDYKTHDPVSKLKGFDEQLGDVYIFLEACGIPIFKQKGLEADDLISICACEWVACNEDSTSIIVSSDRDFFQLVSDDISCYDDRAKIFYGPKEVEAKLGVKPEDVVKYKALLGDKADNIAGIYGYGPKKSAHFAKHKFGYEDFLSSEQQDIFTINKELITLPRGMYCLTGLISPPAWEKLDAKISDAFSLFNGYQLRKINIAISTELLRKYEVKTIHISDFTED